MREDGLCLRSVVIFRLRRVAVVKELSGCAVAKVLAGDGRGLQLQFTGEPDVVGVEQGYPFPLAVSMPLLRAAERPAFCW